MGRLRAWFCDKFAPDMAPNRLADQVIVQLGYRAPFEWVGPVALSMEEDATGDCPEFTPEVRAVLDELTEQARTAQD